MNLLKKIWQKVKQKQNTSPQDKTTFRMGWYIFLFLLGSGIVVAFKNVPLGLALIGIGLIYLGTCLHEVKAPNVAFLFRMGKLVVGELSPGWYLPIPHLWNIEQVPTGWLQEDMDGDMYTAEKTPIHVDARVKFRVNADELEKVLLLMPKEMRERSKIIGVSALRGAVGSSPFETLVKDKGELEDSIATDLKTEFEEHGYIFGDFKINDFDEVVQSEAEKIKKLGAARGEAAKALAEPLKDNFPAALVSMITLIGEAVKNVAGVKKAPKHSGEKPKTEAESETVKISKEEIKGFLENLLGRK